MEPRVASQIFSDRLRQLREGRGLTQVALATGLKMSLAAVKKWEAGETSPTIDNVANVAAFFGVDLASLVDASQPNPQQNIEAAQHLLDQLTPAFQAVRQVIQAAAARKDST